MLSVYHNKTYVRLRMGTNPHNHIHMFGKKNLQGLSLSNESTVLATMQNSATRG